MARALNLNLALRVAKQTGASPNAQGFMSPDAIDGELTFVLGLDYRRCQ